MAVSYTHLDVYKRQQKGSIKLGGDLQMQPLVSNLELDLNAVPILPMQPFFSDKLNITLVRGQLSGKGSLSLAQDNEGLGGGFKGQLQVSDLHTIDKLNSTDFLRWKSLSIGNIETRFQPFSLTLGEVALSDFYSRIIVTPEGKINLSQIIRQPEAEKAISTQVSAAPGVATAAISAPAVEAPAQVVATAAAVATPAKAVAPIRIDKVVFKNGTVRFSDYFVKPNYTVSYTHLDVYKRQLITYWAIAITGRRGKAEVYPFASVQGGMR